jgi:hypothetical protein
MADLAFGMANSGVLLILFYLFFSLSSCEIETYLSFQQGGSKKWALLFLRQAEQAEFFNFFLGLPRTLLDWEKRLPVVTVTEEIRKREKRKTSK